jgi:hypothetical protein
MTFPPLALLFTVGVRLPGLIVPVVAEIPGAWIHPLTGDDVAMLLNSLSVYWKGCTDAPSPTVMLPGFAKVPALEFGRT